MRLAKLNGNGSIYVNPHIKGEARTRVKRHMRVFKKAKQEGCSRNEAIRKARKAEHRHMTKHEVFVYEGRLSAIARETRK